MTLSPPSKSKTDDGAGLVALRFTAGFLVAVFVIEIALTRTRDWTECVADY